ncbi:DUF6766 family protein [Kribbella sp. NPDC049584]|uniref:DUF6766 family protein n=1 Tax=Kribbella sp. NPDC049584 TaxID=3154833 RepID=UPI003412B67A
MSRVRGFVRTNSLSLVFGGLFLAALVGQAFAGLAEYNNQQITDGLATVTFGRYVTSADFAVDVTENWQSEYLQFLLYIVLTVWLVQRGSPESKPLDKAGRESDEEQKVGAYAGPDSPRWARVGGWRTKLFSSSLGLVMGAVFLACWLVQSVAGWSTFNEDQLRQLQDPVSWRSYVGSADFWSRSLQNWQSELLAVGSMAVLSIYLRERGSPESKPVGTSHDATGIEG